MPSGICSTIILIYFNTILQSSRLSTVARASSQIGAYAAALSRIFQTPVKARYLYFFDCGEAVEV